MDLKEIIYNNQKEKHKLENAIGHLTENFNNFVEIRGDELRKIYKDLKKTIEFKDCELIIVDDPHLNFSAIDLEKKHILIEKKGSLKTNSKLCESTKLGNINRFKKKCYLYSLTLSPEVFSHENLNKEVKDGASISPLIYDPTNFEPHKILKLKINHDELVHNKKEIIKNAQKLVEDMINNSEEYTPKGNRHIIFRGVFQHLECDGVLNEKDDFKYLINYEKRDYMVFYFSREIQGEGVVNIVLKHKLIPHYLKEAFQEQFGTVNITENITENIINNFLEQNKKK
jgi:hypothetical protein